MEGNRDDAEKCIEFAIRYIQEGNRDKAEKLLMKSERLFPTAKAKELLEKIRSGQSDENMRQRKFSGPKREEPFFTTSENKENVGANKEHLDAVKRIKKCKDYYEMLGVTKEATDSEIKKAYKKLALQLHPDKNKSPGAAEAFKALGNAAGVLTDPEKRKQYDQFGSDQDRLHHYNNARGGDHTTFHYTRGFEADVTAEELFNMFFGGGFPSERAGPFMRRNGRVFRRQEHPAHNEQQQNSAVAVQLLPILALVLLSMMSSFFVSDPLYSLHPSAKFPIQRKSLNLKVPYYVKENFANDFQGSLRELEAWVEEDYVKGLRNACYKEKSYRDSMMYKARQFNNKDLYMKAQSQSMPSCEALSQLHESRG